MGKKKGPQATLATLTEPFGANLLISRPRAIGRGEAKQTKSGIFLPADATTEYGRVCRVLLTGPKVEAVKPGDTIIVAEFAGLPIYTEADEDEVFVVGEGDVIAKVDSCYWLQVAGREDA